MYNSFIYSRLLTSVFVVLFFVTGIAQNTEDKIIRIDEGRYNDNDISNYKEWDVIVFKTLCLGSEGYSCNFYRLENNGLHEYMASYMTDEVYDQAYFHWENDTTVNLRLFNSTTMKEQKMKIWGNGSTRGMSVDNSH